MKTVPGQLFQINLCTFSLKLSLNLLSLCFGNCLFYYLRSTVNYCLSFLQSKTCNLTYNLNNLNLGRTS